MEKATREQTKAAALEFARSIHARKAARPNHVGPWSVYFGSTSFEVFADNVVARARYRMVFDMYANVCSFERLPIIGE